MDVDVVVIGAGQAGLAMGYYLRQTNKSFLLLDKGEHVGDTWRKRYDSLILFTPRIYSSLPGLPLEGEQQGLPTKDEIADYLEEYAQRFAIPIQLNSEVKRLRKLDDEYQVITNQSTFTAKHVVVATGPFQSPFVPRLSVSLPSDILQVHSSSYTNPAQLQEGPVLVVGGGNSGAQIAVELSAERETYLSVGHSFRFLPMKFMSKNIFWWFDRLGLLSVNINTGVGAWISQQPDPIFGFELKEKIRKGEVIVKPRTKRVETGDILFEDGTHVNVNNVVWATGFIPSYDWLDVEGALNEQGKPIHRRGVSPIKGLYFLGLPWQYRRGSALIGGVGRDAAYLSEILAKE